MERPVDMVENRRQVHCPRGRKMLRSRFIKRTYYLILLSCIGLSCFFTVYSLIGDKDSRTHLSLGLFQSTQQNISKSTFCNALLNCSVNRFSIHDDLAGYRPPSSVELKTSLSQHDGFDIGPPKAYLKGWKTPCWWHSYDKLRCLPAFYIPGFPKCATMDLWMRLIRHPQLKANKLREAGWWNRARYKGPCDGCKGIKLSYASSYYGRKVQIGEIAERSIMLGDGTPSYLWLGHTDLLFKGNMKKTTRPDGAPRVLTPHLIHHYTPQAKFIVPIRNPTDRVFSHYLYHGSKTRNPGEYNTKRSQKKFHDMVVKTLEIYRCCFATKSVRECAYDPSLHRSKVRIDRTLYPVYVADWLKIFPRDQFLFINVGDYGDNLETFLPKIFRFLGVRAMPPGFIKHLSKIPREHTDESFRIGPMWNKTRDILDDFFRPMNEALVDILNDQSFLFKR